MTRSAALVRSVALAGPAVLAAALALFPPAPAAACAWMPPLDLTAAPAAEMVFEGRLLSYEPHRLPANPAVITHAVATFEVTAAIVGEPAPIIRVLMLDNLVGAPETWRWDGTVIVATLPPGTPDTAWTGYHNPMPDLPVLLHPVCGTPFVAPATDETRAAIRAALDAAG